MPVTECECAGVVEQKHCTTLACSTSSSCLQWVPWEQSPRPGVACTNLRCSSSLVGAEQAIVDCGIRKQCLLLPVLLVISCVCDCHLRLWGKGSLKMPPSRAVSSQV